LTTFYALVSGTCFALVGLWWNVVERHPEWAGAARTRRLAGGIYLSFLLPGLMSLLAQVDASNAIIWRTSFVAVAAVGCASTIGLIRVDRGSSATGPFGRHRWVPGLLYGLVLVLGVVPELASVVGLSPLQAEALLLVVLIVIAHGLTWEFLMENRNADA
jgi:hypothetical protein